MSDAYLLKSVDASRVGRAVEHLVAASCILSSNARLNVSTSIVDDEGVDMVFHQRNRTATLGVQVKCRATDTSRLKRGSFMTEVRRATFRPRDDLYMLFVVADKMEATFGPVWLVPSKNFANLALPTAKGTKLRIVASIRPGSKDKWSPYRLERIQLASRLLEHLDSLERKPVSRPRGS